MIHNWLISHSPNPWPAASSNSIKKLLQRVINPSTPARQTSRKRYDIRDSEAKLIAGSAISKLKESLRNLSEDLRGKVLSEWKSNEQRELTNIINSIKEVVGYRISSDRKHEDLRSTIISACCGPQVDLKALSEALGLYQNRKFHKFKLYQTRRSDYMMGITDHMSGCRYAANLVNFSTIVIFICLILNMVTLIIKIPASTRK